MDSELRNYTESPLLQKKSEPKVIIEASKIRWWIISIFMAYASVNSLQWIEYSSITNVVAKYYSVSSLAVDWTSTVYLAVYPVFVIPASFLIEKKGVRKAVLLGCTATFLGTALKIFSIRSDLFAIVLTGNTICSIAASFIGCLPAKLASLWFKENEVATACALGIIGMQLGCAVGYILPPFLVQDHPNIEDIGSQLKILCWVLPIALAPMTVAVYLYFPDRPEVPPSTAQALIIGTKQSFDSKHFLESFKTLLTNKPFLVHIVPYSILMSVYSAVSTILAQFITQHFENADQEAGLIGFVMTLVGLGGMFSTGILLDKTKKYKETAFSLYLASALSILCLMFTLKYKLRAFTYTACVVLGGFTNAYLLVGFEVAIELTFPADESATTGILLAISQIVSVGFVVVLGYLNTLLGGFWALCSQALALFLGAVITVLVPNIKRRQDAFKSNVHENVKSIQNF